MAGEISYVMNPGARQTAGASDITAPFSPDTADRARAFHRTLPGYWPTPLESLTASARRFKVKNLWVKDESFRLGLSAFKVLGASYALAGSLAERLDLSRDNLSFNLMQLPSPQAELNNITVTTATDGNHGRAVAWAAKQAGCPAVIYMPWGSAQSRIKAIEFYGAEVKVIDGFYDEAVEQARADAETNGWLLVQDSSWAGYESIPTLIMQGYLTMMDETFEQLSGEVPTHVFIQSGVGSFAAAVLAYLVERFGDDRPVFSVVEPDRAACMYESFQDPVGGPRKTSGDLRTMMAGLACGLPSLLAWDILNRFADAFITCTDWISRQGMIGLGCPAGADPRIVSGESGAVTFGLLNYARIWLGGALLERDLRLNSDSQVLLVSTEGATDPENYRKIVGINGF